MTLLPWEWFAVGSLVGGGLLAGLVELWARACRRSADRVRAVRLAQIGLLVVVTVQAFGWVPRFDIPRPAIGAVVVSEAGEAGVAAPVDPPSPAGVAVWPLWVWVCGAVAFGGLFVARRVRLNRLRRLAEWTDPAVMACVTDTAARLGLAGRPRTVVGRAGSSPFVFGVVRPVLVLPPDFARLLSPPQQQAVLAHEFAHLTGRDPLWTVLAEATTALVWWSPVTWWLACRHRSACEAAADDSAGRIPDGPGLLAESLFVLAARMTDGPPRPASAAGGRCRSALARRVRRLLSAGPSAPASRGLGGWCGVVVVWAGIAVAVTAGLSLTHAASGQCGLSLAALVWPDPPPPPAGPSVPRTLGDLHPELRTDPEYAALAGYRVGVIRMTPDGRPQPAGEGERPATEEEAFDHIGVTAEQRAKLLALKAETWEATKLMYRSPHDRRVTMGPDINRRWRVGLKAVLTADQYRRYQEFWRTRPMAVVQLP
jgi:beta-lactamase regulating signal transducer with metallopeptidase domain